MIYDMISTSSRGRPAIRRLSARPSVRFCLSFPTFIQLCSYANNVPREKRTLAVSRVPTRPANVLAVLSEGENDACLIVDIAINFLNKC